MGLLSKLGGGKNKNPKVNTDAETQDAHTDTTSKKAKKKAKGDKPGKQPKQKKSLFGGKKKELTLLERMQLEESVAAASLDVVQELADEGHSAVRELDDGFLIVAITNEMLEEVGLDPSSEEFGSFVEGLRSETIESIALAEDLADGVVGIIPSQETLIALEEFDFIHELEFRWAIVPFDLEDEDRLILLDGTVHIERLMSMANNPDIRVRVENGDIVDVDGSDSHDEFEDNYNDDQGFDDDSDELDDAPSDSDELDDAPEVDDGFDDDLDSEFDDNSDDDLDSGFDSNSDVGFDDNLDDGFDDLDGLDDMDGFDDSLDGGFDDMGDLDSEENYTTVAVEEELMSPEETKEVINRAAEHSFNNTELDLHIDMSIFDDYFDSITIAKFDTTKQDDSELQNVISKLRQDANIELQRFHQENIQALRNKYTTSMREIHNKLVESLDHKNQNTTYGSKFYEIENEFEDAMDDIDRFVAGEVERIHQEYNREREEFAENARREALATYDSRYKDIRDRKIASVRDEVQADIKTKRDIKIGELYEDRRTVAQRLFDKATTALLQKLQEEYQRVAQKELQMYDAFRKDMDAYLRQHFADEVLRAKAEAEKLRQSHEAERVRQEYEQLLLAKTAQLKEADERAREAIRQLEETHKEQIEHIKADYERRIEREQRDNQNLREMLAEATESSSKIGEQKEKEIEHRMNLYKDQLEAKERELEYANQRAKDANRPMKFILGAVGAIAIALGIIIGFLMGVGQTQHIAPSAPDIQTQDEVGFNHIQDHEVNDSEFDSFTIDYNSVA